MDSVERNDRLYVQVVRLLFKYNLVPRSHAEEQAFLRELNELLGL